MANWYVSSVGWTAVAQFAVTTAYTVGNLVRQLAAPTVNNERVFRCTTAGTSAGAEAAWNLNNGNTTTQGTAVFTEVTGKETFQGTGWAAPSARLFATISGGTWAVAGDTVYVSADHAETTAAAISWNANNILASPLRLVCVARPSASIPPASTDITTGGSVTTTGANGMTLTGCFYMYGLRFNSGTGASGTQSITFASAQRCIFEQCTFALLSTTGSGFVDSPIFATGRYAYWKNCNLVFSAAGNNLRVGSGPFLWDGGSISGTAPTTLFGAVSQTSVDIRNVDLSLLSSASSLVALGGSPLTCTGITFTNCKLDASAVVTSGAYTNHEDTKVDLTISDSGTNTSREEHYRYAGSVIADIANYQSGGATDGTTHKSWKFASSANASIFSPLEGPDIFIWLDSPSGKTLTMYIANTSSLTLKDTEFGFDVDFMGSALTPLGTISTTFPNILNAGTNIPTNSVSWTGLSPNSRQQVSLGITTALRGWVRVRPLLKRANATIWVDPLVFVQ